MALTIVPLATRTASGNALVLTAEHIEQYDNCVFMLDVTATTGVVADTMDLFIQHSPDDGVTYDDFVRFLQVKGNDGAVQRIAHWLRQYTPTDVEHAVRDATISPAGVKVGPVGHNWRAKWVIAGTGSFTFRLFASPYRVTK